ncbi:MAG: conjugal transfer protein TraD [Sphingomonas sp.]
MRRPLLTEIRATAKALRRAAVQRNRLTLTLARHDRRDWQVKRRERTRQLIELGGLIAKAGLVEMTDDDRAVILGLLDEAAAKLRNTDRDQQLLLWRRRGRHAFDAAD